MFQGVKIDEVATHRNFLEWNGRTYEVFEVEVLSRAQQVKCKHEFRKRLWSEVRANWGSVCKKCGMTARGSR